VEPLAAELAQLARWLKLDGVAVTSRRGELMRALKKLAIRRVPNATPSRKGRQPRTV